MKHIVDLRSDTVTKPSLKMWEAVKSLDNSKIGDDVLIEDPTVNELEKKAAKLVGKEAALYVTSGTQGNLISLLCQTQPGDEILIEEISHIYSYEVGGAARIGGLMVKTYPSKRGIPDYELLQGFIRNNMDVHQPSTSLISLENTHNYHGGAVILPERMKEMREFADKNNLKFHLDGARVFNAVVASKRPITEFTQHVDSIMFCLSKGLSCPIGSLIAGSYSFIDKARRYRKMLGGGWRQAGILATMGLVALEPKWISRLEEDHENAKLLADAFKDSKNVLEVIGPDTNIIIVKFPKELSTAKINSALKKAGILAFNKKDTIRFVTHYGITREDIQYSIEKIQQILGKIWKN